jgi:hypothetical protein
VSEKLEILEMLNQGTITVEEANRLLEAVQDDTSPAAESKADSPPAAAPDLQRFRNLSYIPFGVSVLLLVLAAWGTFALSRRADGQITAGFVVMVVVLVLCSLLTWLTLAMTRMPWLHVRVRDRSEQTSKGKPTHKRFIISLPVPLALAQWGLRIAPRYVGEEQVAQVEMAAAVLQSFRHDLGKPGTDPIVIDVDDNDERVQIYFG